MHKLVVLLVFVAFMGCSDDDKDHCRNDDKECDDVKIVGADDTSAVIYQQYSILSAVADPEYLHLKIGVSGCGGERNFQLKVSSWMLKTQPPQRDAWLTFDEQACEAYFTPDLCFDREEIKEETLLRIITATDTTKILLPAARN